MPLRHNDVLNVCHCLFKMKLKVIFISYVKSNEMPVPHFLIVLIMFLNG